MIYVSRISLYLSISLSIYLSIIIYLSIYLPIAFCGTVRIVLQLSGETSGARFGGSQRVPAPCMAQIAESCPSGTMKGEAAISRHLASWPLQNPTAGRLSESWLPGYLRFTHSMLYPHIPH